MNGRCSRYSIISNKARHLLLFSLMFNLLPDSYPFAASCPSNRGKGRKIMAKEMDRKRPAPGNTNES